MSTVRSAWRADVANVLLIDDDPFILGLYQDALTPMGNRLETAADGEEAAELIAGKRYDLIVSDINMRGMDGLELLRTVRRSDLDVPVILVTASPSAESAIRAIEYGAFRYLTKPVSPASLRRVVEIGIRINRMAHAKREALRLMGGDGGQASDRAGREATFERALAFSWMAYQPIVSWSRREVFGYEALARTADPTLSSPMQLIETAEHLGRLEELGRRWRQLAADTLHLVPSEASVFVNIHPHDLSDDDLYSPDSALAKSAKRIVIEITERASLEGIPDVAGKVAALREMGYRIAIDDLGAGHAGLSTFARLEPDIAKLDMGLVRDVDKDPTKRKVIHSMAGLCRDLGIQVITEGVETVEERDTLVDAGCDFLQGYLFGRPDRAIGAVSWN